jgi:hypothetical protein
LGALHPQTSSMPASASDAIATDAQQTIPAIHARIPAPSNEVSPFF